jgi:hypothetical protein
MIRQGLIESLDCAVFHSVLTCLLSRKDNPLTKMHIGDFLKTAYGMLGKVGKLKLC